MIWIAAALYGTVAIAGLATMERWRRQPAVDNRCHHEKR